MNFINAHFGFIMLFIGPPVFLLGCVAIYYLLGWSWDRYMQKLEKEDK